ncbi:MAG: NAD(P)H-dependent oxidoreductase [Pseudohongiella sp.]|nr:NAD(P)H-dependent oxidoreductase [Pseudohongiella sp.]
MKQGKLRKVLRVSSGLFQANSVSSLLMDELLAGMQKAAQNIELRERDFREHPVPHLDAAWLQALMKPASERSEQQQAKVDYSDSLIAELQSADTIIIGLPMYNFSVPSMLKAWIDHIARAGVTFKYTEQGSVGLLLGKKVVLVAAMGGVHEEGASDFLRPYMKQIMSFVGLDDVEFVTADGLNMGSERREQGLAVARDQIEKLIVSYRDESQIAQENVA